jgi:hypothetical protein
MRDIEPLYDYKICWINTQEFNRLLDDTTLEVICPYCNHSGVQAFSHGDAYDVACNGSEKNCLFCNKIYYVSWEGEAW